MPNCDFYGLAPDRRPIVEFIFSQPGWSLFENASRPDHPLREFRAIHEFLEAHPGFDSLQAPLYFHLYSPTMGGSVSALRIDFRPGAVPGASFRYDAQGWGLIQLHFGAHTNGRLSKCHTNHNSRRRAEQWESTAADRLGPVEAWSWPEVARISRRLVRVIHGASATKMGTRPVLPAAFDAMSRGAVLLDPA